MTPPPVVSHQLGEVYRLRKVLYSLKQASHTWSEKFSTIFTLMSFIPSHHDSALFVKRTSVGCILLSLYIDNMIIIGDDCVVIEYLKYLVILQ